jgi:hypothetical protein
VKRGHLSDLEALDLALGDPIADDASAHVGQCAACADRARVLSEGRRLAVESSLPEPDEAFWQQLRAGISARVEQQAARSHRGAVHGWWRWPLAATAAVVLSVGAWSLRSTLNPPTRVGEQPTPVSVASPDDGGSLLASDVVPPIDEDAQSLVDCASCLDGLTDEESRTVIEGLRAEMGKKS